MSHPNDDTSAEGDSPSTGLQFEDTVVGPGTKERLWSVISNPAVLTQCVPGPDNIERLSKRQYTVDITRGISHLTISLSGEVDLVELNEPNWVVANGSG